MCHSFLLQESFESPDQPWSVWNWSALFWETRFYHDSIQGPSYAFTAAHSSAIFYSHLKPRLHRENQQPPCEVRLARVHTLVVELIQKAATKPGTGDGPWELPTLNTSQHSSPLNRLTKNCRISAGGPSNSCKQKEKVPAKVQHIAQMENEDLR